MHRRQYLQAAAVLLGTSTTAAGLSTADDDDEVYDTVVERLDDVTAFRSPLPGEEGSPVYRLYDADTETLAYATTVGTAGEASVAMVLRDASGTEIAS